MKLKLYQVDAFTDKLFSGNPAAVVPLEDWLPGDVLQKIAMENNLSETAFLVQKGDDYLLRWFTPKVEVALCGHATLASAHVLYNHMDYQGDQIVFHTVYSGSLIVTKEGDLLTMNFPKDRPVKVTLTEDLMACFHQTPVAVYKTSSMYMFVFEKESDILSLGPDFKAIAKFPVTGVIATAAGDHSDFVSRFFAPQSGIDEDPVTGSAHTVLTPYWAEQTGKNELSAIQLSARRGYLSCRIAGDRVEISGKARTFMTGELDLDDE